MIEKEAADTVIAKIEEVAAQAAPHIQDFAGDAVGYLVLKQAAITGVLAFCAVMCWVVCAKAIRKARASGGGDDYNEFVEGFNYVLGGITGIVGIICTICALEASVNTLAALFYPQIFAVEKLLGWLN